MRINYNFTSDNEPTDEQLHLLMQEVAVEAKRKAEESDKIFTNQLQQLVEMAKKGNK